MPVLPLPFMPFMPLVEPLPGAVGAASVPPVWPPELAPCEPPPIPPPPAEPPPAPPAAAPPPPPAPPAAPPPPAWAIAEVAANTVVVTSAAPISILRILDMRFLLGESVRRGFEPGRAALPRHAAGFRKDRPSRQPVRREPRLLPTVSFACGSSTSAYSGGCESGNGRSRRGLRDLHDAANVPVASARARTAAQGARRRRRAGL
ncbi:hypothetical protein C6P72_17995 [Burkholderia gladioli]|nr:hypothetical protein C6P72_17995 [Burkholderia gladioli]